MLGLTGRLIARRFEATFAITISATGSQAPTVAIPTVDLRRSIVRVLTVAGGANADAQSNNFSAVFGVDFASASSLRCNFNCTAFGSTMSPVTINIRVQVTELGVVPKSLQTVSGNGASSQSISPVDPTCAEFVVGYGAILNGSPYTCFNPSLAANAVTWTNGAGSAANCPASFRYQIVEA